MKIKNKAVQQEQVWKRPNKNNFANKENIPLSACKPSRTRRTRSKNQSSKENTIQTNASHASQKKISFFSQEIHIELPNFLKKETAFNKQIAPYEDDILKYIVNSYDQKYIPAYYIKKIKKPGSKRIFIIERMYTLYQQFKLRRKTLYLAVYYFDKYMTKFPKDQNHPGLVADACMFIAMKYEEIYPPSITRWQKTQFIGQIYGMQALILQALDFELAITTPQHFLEVYHGKNISVPVEEKRLHELVLDLYLFSGYVYGVHPLIIAQQVLESFRGTSILQRGSNYQQSDANVKHLITSHIRVWDYLIQTEAKYRQVR